MCIRDRLGVLRVVHWGLLLLASYLLIPLLLGFFPPTQVVAEGLRGQIRGVLERLLDGVVAAIPNLLAIVMILLITRLSRVNPLGRLASIKLAGEWI